MSGLASAAVGFVNGDPAVLANDHDFWALVTHALGLLAARIDLIVLDVLVVVAFNGVGRAEACIALAARGGTARRKCNFDGALVRFAADGVQWAEGGIARADLLVDLRAAIHLAWMRPSGAGGDPLEADRGVAGRGDVSWTLADVAFALGADWTALAVVAGFLKHVSERACSLGGRAR